jgi:hypothetical protein
LCLLLTCRPLASAASSGCWTTAGAWPPAASARLAAARRQPPKLLQQLPRPPSRPPAARLNMLRCGEVGGQLSLPFELRNCCFALPLCKRHSLSVHMLPCRRCWASPGCSTRRSAAASSPPTTACPGAATLTLTTRCPAAGMMPATTSSSSKSPVYPIPPWHVAAPAHSSLLAFLLASGAMHVWRP